MLVEMLKSLVEQQVIWPSLPDVTDDVLAILARVAMDSFPEVKIASAKCVQVMVDAVPLELHRTMEKVVVSLLANMSHQRSKVRLATFRALGSLMPCGAERLESLMVDKVIPSALSFSKRSHC